MEKKVAKKGKSMELLTVRNDQMCKYIDILHLLLWSDMMLEAFQDIERLIATNPSLIMSAVTECLVRVNQFEKLFLFASLQKTSRAFGVIPTLPLIRKILIAPLKPLKPIVSMM